MSQEIRFVGTTEDLLVPDAELTLHVRELERRANSLVSKRSPSSTRSSLPMTACWASEKTPRTR